MAIATTIIIALVVTALYYILRAISPEFKRATRWVTIVSNILLVISIIFAVMVYLDFNALAKEFPKTSQLFILDNDKDIPVAFTISFAAGQTDITKALNPVSAEDRKAMNARYRMGDYKAVLGSNYKLFIMKRQFFESIIPGSIELFGINISRADILKMIDSEDSIDVLVELLSESMGISDIMKPLMKTSLVSQLKTESDSDFKTLIFATVLMQSLSKDGTVSPLQNMAMMDAYRNDMLIIYPETLLFKVMKLVPSSAFEQASALANNK